MRQGQQNRRGRGRPNNNRGKGQNPLTRSFQSNGPDVKIHGTPSHIAEKYISLARDSLAMGDAVKAENYLQHAEHYNRIILTFREQQMAQHDSTSNGGQPHHGGRSAYDGSEGAESGREDMVEADGGGIQVRGNEPQPHVGDASAPREDGRGRRQGTQRSGRPPRTSRSAPRSQGAANGEQPHSDTQSGRGDKDTSRISDGKDAPSFLRNPVTRAGRRRPAREPEAATVPAAKDED